MPRVTPTRAKRSKQEVEQQAASATPKAAELARAREVDIRQAVGGITVEAVVQKMSSLGLEVSKALRILLREAHR